MSALRIGLAVAAAAVAVSCSQPSAVSSAGLVGSHDVLVHDRFVFVTSADRNELRVLDTIPPGLNGKVFLRAPNPLESLSIPVLPGANTLAQDEGVSVAGDTRIDGGVLTPGSPKVGKFIFASRSGTPAISIVSADPATTRPGGATGAEPIFRELRRLPTAAPVNATAGWLSADRKSRLYFATFDGDLGSLYSLDLENLNADDLPVKHLATLTGESVAALAVVPPMAARTLNGSPFCSANECLVVASRGAKGEAGRTLLLDPKTLVTATLDFPGPVRALKAAPQVTFRLEGDPEEMSDRIALEAGERIFGTLDEEKCGSFSCGGIAAVDTRTGTGGHFGLARDSTGQPMVPLIVGNALVTGLALAPGADVLLSGTLSATGSAGVGTFPLLGVTTASNGDVFYFDALNLLHLDLDLSGPVLTGATLYDPSGTATAYAGGPIITRDDGTPGVTLGDGVWFSQQVIIAQNGVIPGLRSVDASVGVTQVAPDGMGSRIRVGDSVTFTGLVTSCAATVTDVQADVFTVDAACPGATTFGIKAGPTDPLVVQGSVAGFLGRSTPGGHLDAQLPLIFRPPGQGPVPTALSMDFGPAQVAPGSFWALDIDAHFSPYVVKVDGTQINCSASALQYAVKVAWSAVQGRFYMLYPSGNALMELNTAISVPSTQLGVNGGMICYR